jgi:predicted DNA-binding mobile mystery protein A
MSLKKIVLHQYQEILDRAGTIVRQMTMPNEGWLCTARKALGLSGAQLARRMGVSRAHISQTEKKELSGSVTLKKMEQISEAMGCRFIYAIVPATTTGDIVAARAREKAVSIVKEASKQMALESQSLTSNELEFEMKRIEKELIDEPLNLWNE